MLDREATIERIRTRPRRPDETWQGGLHRVAAFVRGPGTPFRPLIAAWVAVEADLVGPGELLPPEEATIDAAIASLIAFIEDDTVGGYVPGRVEVKDPALAERLSELLTDAGVTVECVPALDRFERVMRRLDEHMLRGERVPGLLDAEGVTLDLVRAFAEAAADFARAEPWRELQDVDLIQIESPRPPHGFECAMVLGAGGEVFGLGFCRSAEEFRNQAQATSPAKWLARQRQGIWSCTFSNRSELPAADLDLWEAHGLPLAAAEMYPHPACFRPEKMDGRPSASQLEFLEGLLRALAAAEGPDFDAGRWTNEVQTFRGHVEFTLALPDVLDPPRREELMRRGCVPDVRGAERGMLTIQRFLDDSEFQTIDEVNAALAERFAGRCFDEDEPEPRTPLEKAQRLCYDAFDARGRRRLQLARQALEVCPDCADAYVILAERTSDSHEARDLSERGVAAGERALGPDRLEREAGELWGSIDARPYLRARFGLAGALRDLEALDDAVDQYRRLLELDANDHQGARYPLLVCLLQSGRDDEAAELLRAFDDDDTPLWRYGEVIIAYRAGGDSAAARAKLALAAELNPRVIEHLVDDDEDAPGLPLSTGLDDDEVFCAEELRPVVATTPGAREWLERYRAAAAAKPVGGRAAPRRGKERRRKSR